MINKIILFGSTGMLGRYIYKYFKNNTSIIVSTIDFRITNETIYDIERHLEDCNIDENTCIINCIGIIPQRKKIEPYNYNEYLLINSLLPSLLSIYSKKYKSKMIQPTTDCIYNGINGLYNEYYKADNTDIYGISKYLGENCEATIIRTSIIGFEIKNKKSFIEWVLSNNKNTVYGWNNHLWNGITCLEYCNIIKQIIEKDLFWTGIRHIMSPNYKSKYEMINIIKKEMNLDIEVIESKTDIKIDRRLETIHKSFIESLNIKPIEKQIKDLINFNIE